MCSNNDYRAMLLDIARHLCNEDLEGMQFLCADGRCNNVKTTLQLFLELERQNKLGIDKLDVLKWMLENVKRNDLVVKLAAFQLQRNIFLKQLCSVVNTEVVAGDEGDKTPTKETFDDTELTAVSEYSSTHSSTQPTGSRQPGEVSLRCILKLASTGVWVGGYAYVLNRYIDDPDALVNIVTKVILPTGILLRYISAGSIKLSLWATDLDALRELWRRYQTGQLRDDLHKVLVTEELKSQSNGELIELDVEISEAEYGNACLDLWIAQNRAERVCNTLLTARHRSYSLPDMTSSSTCSSWGSTKDFCRAASLLTGQVKDGFQNTNPSLTSFEQNSFESNTSADNDPLLSDFLAREDNARNVCSLLDRNLLLGNDWRSLACEFRYEMIYIRLWERHSSPSLTLLEDIVLKMPYTRVSTLIDKLSALERNDVVRVLQGNEANSDAKTLSGFPFTIRKQFACELDNAPETQFYDVVRNIFNCLRPFELESFRKCPSPTMALLEELESMCPSTPLKLLRDACMKGEVSGAVRIIDSFTRKKSLQALRISTDSRLRNICPDRLEMKRSSTSDSAIDTGPETP